MKKLMAGTRPVCTPQEFLMCPFRDERCEQREADSPCPRFSHASGTGADNTNVPGQEDDPPVKQAVKVCFSIHDAELYEAAKQIADEEGRFMGRVLTDLLRLYVYDNAGRLVGLGLGIGGGPIL